MTQIEGFGPLFHVFLINSISELKCCVLLHRAELQHLAFCSKYEEPACISLKPMNII